MSLQSLLDEHERTNAGRTNASNDGRGFQSELERTNLGYEQRGIAVLQKVDPPVRILGGGRNVRKVIFMKNPFNDYIGTWTARYGRALFIEAKSTQTERLQFNGSGNFTIDQWTAMKRWRRAGAACALLWQVGGRVRLWLPEALLAAERAEERAISFESGLPVPRGLSNIVWDYLPVLQGALWPVKKAENTPLLPPKDPAN